MIVLLMDEAHLMSIDTLRRIRLMLDDFPNNFNLILIGQPALLKNISLGVNDDLRTRITYSVTLKKILPDAEARGLKLGVENREALEEIPFETDFPFFFREFTSPSVVYWHDTGHAQIKENLGFIHHTLHLQTFRDRLAGFHIHDVQPPARDHCAPGSGSVDFGALKPMVKPQHIKVFEFSPAMPVEVLKQGVAHVKRLWGES